MAAFARYIGIDYSGAKSPCDSLPGLRVYMVEGEALPVEVPPPPSPRKYWTRRGFAEWLVETIGEFAPALVGIDHGFSFPLGYFQAHDFQRHWPTDEDHHLRRFCARWRTGQRRSADG